MTPVRLLRPSTSRLPLTHSLARLYSDNSSQHASTSTGSAKLWADAAREEAAEASAEAQARSDRLTALTEQDANWTGDESVQDAVLRMLVDKYKPLRGPIRTAEEKLRTAPPQVRTPDSASYTGAVGTEMETQTVRDPDAPILPGIEGHKPWHTTFNVPSHAAASVRYGHPPPPPRALRGAPAKPDMDEKARRAAREAKRRTEQAGRLSRARDSTLDYRLGIKGGPATAATEFRRPNPVSLKGWASLVEDRIERARQEGFFSNVKGRGQPLVAVTQERNPFIGREEFLMNRIVQRQGGAPPWVEVQQELENAVASFRGVIKQSWTRRALRTLTASQPAALIPRLSLADAEALRDAEWEARERSYHDTALGEINSLVRKYNGLAPYAVRRAYYARETELERAYKDAGEDILRGLAERMHERAPRRQGAQSDEDPEKITGSAGAPLPRLRLRDLLREWVGALGWR